MAACDEARRLLAKAGEDEYVLDLGLDGGNERRLTMED
jgi:hypothetical protein